MAINFSVNDYIRVVQDYVTLVLAPAANSITMQGTVAALGYFQKSVAQVLEIGTVTVTENNLFSFTRPYIRLVPLEQSHVNYHGGLGVILYFDNDTQINDSLEYSTAYIDDILSTKALNNTGFSIPKFSTVYHTGFDVPTQLPTIALASAAVAASSSILGITEDAIGNGASGSVLIEGSVSGINTVGGVINGQLFLSNTPGQIAFVAGTVSSVIGRVESVGVLGSIAIRGVPAGGSGGGGGSAGNTGIQGVTGFYGNTGIQGLGVTGLMGPGGGQGATGIVGNTGLPGVQGNTGILGGTGVQGYTGIPGIASTTGLQGVTGLIGNTGILGFTGLLGNTGLQGNTGLLGGGFQIEFIPTVANSQTAFTLPSTPLFSAAVLMIINTATYYQPTYFTISGTSVTWLNIFILASTDNVAFIYS
jgi:hypothetical protein